MADVYICTTTYHFLITLVKTLNSGDRYRLILCTHGSLDEAIINRIRKSNIFLDVTVYDNIDDRGAELDYSKWYFFKHADLQRQLDEIVPWKHTKGDEYYIYNDVSIMGKWLNSHRIRYNLIEDGLNCYMMPGFINLNYQETKLKRMLNQLFDVGFYCFGSSKYMKSLEVNCKDNLLISHSNIIEKNRKEMFMALDEKQKETIIKIFLSDEEIDNLTKKLKKSEGSVSTLLLTQPLFDDGMASKDIHIKFYKDIVDKYQKGKLIIKTHPRDTINYSEFFKDAIIINKCGLPVEVIGFLDILKLERALTWCSTSIDNIDYADEKITLGFDYFSNYAKEDRDNGFVSRWHAIKQLL